LNQYQNPNLIVSYSLQEVDKENVVHRFPGCRALVAVLVQGDCVWAQTTDAQPDLHLVGFLVIRAMELGLAEAAEVAEEVLAIIQGRGFRVTSAESNA